MCSKKDTVFFYVVIVVVTGNCCAGMQLRKNIESWISSIFSFKERKINRPVPRIQTPSDDLEKLTPNLTTVFISPNRNIQVAPNSNYSVTCSGPNKGKEDFLQIVHRKGDVILSSPYIQKDQLSLIFTFKEEDDESEIFCNVIDGNLKPIDHEKSDTIKVIIKNHTDEQVVTTTENNDVTDGSDGDNKDKDVVHTNSNMTNSTIIGVSVIIAIVILAALFIFLMMRFHLRCRRNKEPIYAVPDEVVQYVQLELPPPTRQPAKNEVPYVKIIGIAKKKNRY